MKRKLLVLLVTLSTLSTFVGGCKGEEKIPVADVEVEETETEIKEKDDSYKELMEKEVTSSEVQENLSYADMTPQQLAEAKVLLVKEANNKLSEVPENKELLLFKRTFDNSSIPEDLKTKDGISLKEFTFGAIAAVDNFFYDYVNNDQEISTNLINYIENNNYHDITSKYHVFNENGEFSFDTNNIIMCEAVRIAPYLSKTENITFGELTEGTVDNFMDAEVAYTMDVILDGNNDAVITAIFDENINLLNLQAVEEDYPCIAE